MKMSDNTPATELEKEYRAAVNRVRPQIEANLKQASRLIEDAMKLADVHDLPMHVAFGTSYNGCAEHAERGEREVRADPR